MKTSPEIDKIAPAFKAAQAAMNAASKSATNPHFKSKYADLATVIDAVKGPLNEAGIAFLQTVTADTTGIMVTTILMHESGQWFEETLYLPVPQQTPQAYGSGITYAKRYSLQSMCGLPSEDDDGERASQPEKADAHRVEAKPAMSLKEAADMATIITDMVNAGDAAGVQPWIDEKGLTIEQRLFVSAQLSAEVRQKLQKIKAPQLRPPPLASQG